MEIKVDIPPNYEAIKIVLNPPRNAIFAYGNIIYNPSGLDIPEDIKIHEEVHQRQQGDQIQVWWGRYLQDREFRFNQEVEAYSEQYHWLKERLPERVCKQALVEMTTQLKELYKLDISYGRAERLIKQFKKG